ncbi:unnamed protein product [Agarophyton chilense]
MLRAFAMRLLGGERLGRTDAAALGALLFRTDGDYALKALIAHVMRVRHESACELAGLALAARHSVEASFAGAPRSSHAYALIAEPYDGTQRAALLTPLLAYHLYRRHALRVVLGVGESGGPKRACNLRDVARALSMRFARDGAELRAAFDDGARVVAVDQSDLSGGLHAWVPLRRVIVKRPAIACVEKFGDAVGAHGCDLFVASAFHDEYVHKMAVAAEALRYGAYIIVGRGAEGSTALSASVSRAAVLLSGCRRRDGSYVRREQHLVAPCAEVVGAERGGRGGATRGLVVDAQRTARWVRAFEASGASGDALFDCRAHATLRAFDAAIDALRRDGWTPPVAVADMSQV